MAKLQFTKTRGLYMDNSSRVRVYEGLLTQTNTPIAIKEQVFPSLAQANAAIRETMIQMSLHHPNICAAYDCFLQYRGEEVVSVLLLELLDKDLNREIRERKELNVLWEEADILEILTGLVSALSYAESKGICHRDIKPQNIFLKDRTAKIGDFGSAAQIGDEKTMNSVSGSPVFFSPEMRLILREQMQLEAGQRTYDPFKSDIYSLGVTVLYMAMLRVPEELMELSTLRDVTTALISSLQEYPNLQELLPDMLSLDPEARPSFRDIERKLSRYDKDYYASLQQSMAIEAVHGAETLRPCCICKSPIFQRSWTRYVPQHLLVYCDYFTDLCSLQCLGRLKNQLDAAATAVECVWCRKLEKVVASEAILLPCGHTFHSKLCLFRFLVCVSDNLRNTESYACPSCSSELSHHYIEEMLGSAVYDEAVFLYTKDLCSVCYDRNAEFYCRADHCLFCSKCTHYSLYVLKSCPSCHSLRISPLPASTKDRDIELVLTRSSH